MAKEKSPQNATSQSDPNLEEKIRCRAYELHEGRGRQGGHEINDWLTAEAEIIAKNSKTVAV